MQAAWRDKKIIALASEKFGTPFYLYDASLLEDSYLSLRDALPKEVDIFYSIKANPSIAVCNQLKSLGARAELCSYYEILAALKAGFSPNDIIFVGPAKSDQEIRKCIELGVFAIICESLNEYKRISEISKQCNKVARVALRINPSHISKSALLKMGGKASQFGMDEEIVYENKKYFMEMPNIKIIGIHVYNGTRILNANTVIENTEYILNLAQFMQKEWGINFEMVDIGGGLGVPYFDSENELDLAEVKAGIKPIIENYLASYPGTRIILESGRYLVAQAGVFVSRVLDIKFSKGEKFAVTDGGTNCHMAAVGVGSFVKRNFPMSAVCFSDKTAQAEEVYNITGPLCTPGDLIGKQVVLPKLSIGDFVLVEKSGAYGPTASPVMFLSHGFPAEVLYKDGAINLIRERFTESEFIEKQNLIN